MQKQHNGFTLMEMMVAVAIVGILVAVALPEYRNHIQRSANNACLSEAKAYVSFSASRAVGNFSVPGFNPVSCASGGSMTRELYLTNSTLQFIPRLRGAVAVRMNTRCEAGSAVCRLQ